MSAALEDLAGRLAAAVSAAAGTLVLFRTHSAIRERGQRARNAATAARLESLEARQLLTLQLLIEIAQKVGVQVAPDLLVRLVKGESPK